MKQQLLLLLLLLPSLLAAQSMETLSSGNLINKGNFILKLGYEHQPALGLRTAAPKVCLCAGYSVSDWCIIGLYSDYGKDFTTNILVTDGNVFQYTCNYLYYGIHTEFHPIALLFPGFYLVDGYAILRTGMHHFICDIVSEEGYNPNQEYLTDMLKNTTSPNVSCGFGFAINPSKYFGLFYEGTITSLEYRDQDRFYLFNRFGINCRIRGPKR